MYSIIIEEETMPKTQSAANELIRLAPKIEDYAITGGYRDTPCSG